MTRLPTSLRERLAQELFRLASRIEPRTSEEERAEIADRSYHYRWICIGGMKKQMKEITTEEYDNMKQQMKLDNSLGAKDLQNTVLNNGRQ